MAFPAISVPSLPKLPKLPRMFVNSRAFLRGLKTEGRFPQFFRAERRARFLGKQVLGKGRHIKSPPPSAEYKV